jgi:hypothetical protein
MLNGIMLNGIVFNVIVVKNNLLIIYQKLFIFFK